MRWLFVTLLWCLVLGAGSTAQASGGRVLKVLPEFLDGEGRHARTPSLYDRDAYQAYLRSNPAKRSALRFYVQWKANVPESEALKMRVELRGVARGNLPKELTLEQTVRQRHWFSHWAELTLGGDEFQQFGEVTAWRVTLWDGDWLLSEQKSFLW
jgi:hypothetical protein